MLSFSSSRRVLAAAVATGVVALAAQNVSAVQIYAFDNLGTTNVGSIGDRFIRFDTANPAGTVVTLGTSGVANRGMSGLDFAGNGNLYSVSGFNSDSTAFAGSQLFSVNKNTGASTLIGNCNLPTGYAATDLSWNPVSQQMFMIAANGTTNPNRLYTVNLGTGAANLIGDITGIAGGLDVGLASNSAGVNYLHDIVSDRMYSLAGTAATGLPSPVGIDCNFSQGMVINWQQGNGWYLGAITSSLISEVVQINNATGAGTVLPNGVWPTHSNGLPEYETGDLAIAPIPEPASLALAGGLLAGFALRRRRSR